MIIVKNIFGVDPLDFIDAIETKRIGDKIRNIRTEKQMTQSELGNLVGLSGDRIQQYENAYRKPKKPLIKKLAAALGVETLALVEPTISNDLGLMYALFELEDTYNLHLEFNNEKLSFYFGDGKTDSINEYISFWLSRKNKYSLDIKNASSEQEKEQLLREYNNWKYNFPSDLANEHEQLLNEARKQQLQRQKQLMQEESESIKTDNK